MAHQEAVRRRARQLFMGRAALEEISSRVGVPLGTLKRWSREERWSALRRAHARLEQASAAVALELAERARETGDPQQAYAMSMAAELSRAHAPPAPAPSARDVAKALLRVLESHAVLGPPLRRHRAEIITLVASEVERLEESVG